jgi:peptide/nickel transport system permease protein
MTADVAYAAAPRAPFDWPLLAGLVVVALVGLAALLSLVWTPYAGAVATPLAEPGVLHWLGTDAEGQDVVSMLMVATLSSLSLAGFATLLCLLAGIPVGAVIALRYEGDMPGPSVLGLPAFALAIALVVSGMGVPGTLTVIAAIVLPGLLAAVLLVVAYLRPLWRLDFVTSARLAGLGPLSTIQRHVVPRLLPPLTATAFELLAVALLIEVMLGFAGLGPLPPGTSLGLLLRDGQQFLTIRPLLVVAPGLVTVITALALITVAARCRHGAR